MILPCGCANTRGHGRSAGKQKRMSRAQKQSVSDGVGRLMSLTLLSLGVILAAPPALAQTASRRSSDRTAPRKSAAANFDALAKRADEAREANRLEDASALYLQA